MGLAGISNLSRAFLCLGYGLLRASRNVTFALVAAFPALADEPVTLVALGDSLTAGYGLAEGEGLVPQLQAWLDAAGADVILQNAGVSGDTTAGGLARLDWSLGPDARGLMVILGGNDMMRGLPVSEVEANLQKIMAGAKARGLPVLVVGMKAPANWGPEYKAAFDAIYPALGADLYLDDFFTALWQGGASPSDPAAMARYMQADHIHPNAAGVAEIVKALGPKLLELAALARP